MAAVPFISLPNDILIQIIVQVKRSFNNYRQLLSCLLVNKRWYEITKPILYGNIAFNDSRLGLFVERLNLSQYSSHVRSITLRLGPGHDFPLHEQVAQLTPLISRLDNLSSFSLWLHKDYDSAFLRSTLMNLINALPVSCTCLEIDTQANDDRPMKEPAHACDAIRFILPRMQHVRLQLGAICKSLFMDPSKPDENITLPHIQTLVVNCSQAHGYPPKLCGPDDHVPFNTYHGHPDVVWSTVTNGLECLVEKKGATPKDAKIYAVIASDHNYEDRSIWQAQIRADMLAKESWAFPQRSIWMEGMIPGSWLIRLENGRDLMSVLTNLEALAEGQPWRDVVGGARLPAAILEAERLGQPSFATGCVEAPLVTKTSQQWREDNPRKGHMLWQNERQTGMRLLEPENRVGKDKYLSLDQIREITPLGWQRVGSNNNTLEKIGVQT